MAKARKLPKRIGGLKLPKEVRARADWLLGLAGKPIVSETLAATLLAVALAISEGKNRREILKAAGLGAGAAAVKAANGADRIALAIAIAAAEIGAGRVRLLGKGRKPNR